LDIVVMLGLDRCLCVAWFSVGVGLCFVADLTAVCGDRLVYSKSYGFKLPVSGHFRFVGGDDERA